MATVAAHLLVCFFVLVLPYDLQTPTGTENTPPTPPAKTVDVLKVSKHLQTGTSLVHHEITNSKVLNKFLAIKFEDIPSSLKNLNEFHLQYYAKVLVQERRKIQWLMLLHMTQCWATAFGAYWFDESFIFPFIKTIVLEDEERRKTLEDSWVKHQQRMTDYVMEYLELKKIAIETLPRNHVGVMYVQVPTGPDHHELLPVYLSTKGDPLPPFTSNISSSSTKILQNWWSANDNLPNS